MISLCIRPGFSCTGGLVKHLPHREKLAFLRLVTYLRINAWGLEGNRKRGAARSSPQAPMLIWSVFVPSLTHFLKT
jgi:hypothetical protein